jgi:hypothetical protein
MDRILVPRKPTKYETGHPGGCLTRLTSCPILVTSQRRSSKWLRGASESPRKCRYRAGAFRSESRAGGMAAVLHPFYCTLRLYLPNHQGKSKSNKIWNQRDACFQFEITVPFWLTRLRSKINRQLARIKVSHYATSYCIPTMTAGWRDVM